MIAATDQSHQPDRTADDVRDTSRRYAPSRAVVAPAIGLLLLLASATGPRCQPTVEPTRSP